MKYKTLSIEIFLCILYTKVATLSHLYKVTFHQKIFKFMKNRFYSHFYVKSYLLFLDKCIFISILKLKLYCRKDLNHTLNVT